MYSFYSATMLVTVGECLLAQVLAAFGANFDQAMDKMYSTGNSPIHVAALAGKDNVIQLLASRGLW